MSEMTPGNNSNWKMQTYIKGGLLGLGIGLLGAYLYARAAEEDAERNGGQPNKLQTGQILSIALAVLGLIRQIAESGKKQKK
ncbi:MAG: hypothetical protein ACOCXZ_02590 [Chloroflexota bacterium]